MASEKYWILQDRIFKSGLPGESRSMLQAIVSFTLPGSNVCYETRAGLLRAARISDYKGRMALNHLVDLALVDAPKYSNSTARAVNEALILTLGSERKGDPLFIQEGISDAVIRAMTALNDAALKGLRPSTEQKAAYATVLGQLSREDDANIIKWASWRHGCEPSDITAFGFDRASEERGLAKSAAMSTPKSESVQAHPVATPEQREEKIPEILLAPPAAEPVEPIAVIVEDAANPLGPVAIQTEPAPASAAGPVGATTVHVEAPAEPVDNDCDGEIDEGGPLALPTPAPAPVPQDGELFPSEALPVAVAVEAPEKPKTAAQIRREQAVEVVLYWCDWDTALKLAREKGGNSPSNEARKRNMSTEEGKARVKAVERRLKDGFTVDEIKSAIRGIFNTPHNIGGNDRGGIYTSLQLICKVGGNFDTYKDNDPGECDPRALTLSDLRLSKVRAEMARGDFRNFASNISRLRGGEPPKAEEIDF